MYVLFKSSAAHSTVGLSLLRTAMMMLELDFMNSFNEPFTDNDPVTLYFGGTVIFLLVTFVLLMPILLMNLLVIRLHYVNAPMQYTCGIYLNFTLNIDNGYSLEAPE